MAKGRNVAEGHHVAEGHYVHAAQVLTRYKMRSVWLQVVIDRIMKVAPKKKRWQLAYVVGIFCTRDATLPLKRVGASTSLQKPSLKMIRMPAN